MNIEKEHIVARPTQVMVGMSLAKILEPLGDDGVVLGDGVGMFFGSREFVRPEGEQVMNLTYITPRSLGFNEPSTYTDILKIVGKTRKDLGLCPEETGLVLAGMMLGLDLDGDSNNYYVMSERHQDDLASDFLKIERNGEERIMLSGFSEKTLIGVDDFLVFQGVRDRVDLTNY